MNFEFTDLNTTEYNPLSFDVYPCNLKVKNGSLKGFKNVSTCVCSYCSKSCDVISQRYEAPGYFEGFNLLLVLIVYLVMAVIVVLTYFFNKKREKQLEKNNEEVNEDRLADKLE
eukprot:TRINITY_DN4474_c0_g1_i1.p2 TRINITY_DN4474_c0_g1~~TRINITY_DN4474_c0_g1_i1.p2  ORF type:complete len:114 (+),score=36.04 TRINITY_DN4474_c0_g1_i1:574-915(+)